MWHGRDGRDWFSVGDSVTASSPAAYRTLFQLDVEYESVHNAIIAADPRLEPVIEEFAGLRLMRPQGLVEVVFSFICSQNNNLPRIQSMVRALRLLNSSPYAVGGGLWDASPSPGSQEKVARRSLSEGGTDEVDLHDSAYPLTPALSPSGGEGAPNPHPVRFAHRPLPASQGEVSLSPSGEVDPQSGDGGGNPVIPPSPTASGLPPLGGEDFPQLPRKGAQPDEYPLGPFGTPPPSRQGEELDPHPILPFPTLNQLAQLTETSLRECGFGYRGATIPRAAEAILARGGEAWLQSLKSRPYPEAHEELVSLPGIGRKVADCICLYGLHQDEAVPIDTHIWQAVVRLYRPDLDGKSLTDKRYREIGDLIRDRFGPHAGAAQHYLFYENLRHGRARR